MIFQGIWTRIAKKPYISVIFQRGGGGSGPPVSPLDPHMTNRTGLYKEGTFGLLISYILHLLLTCQIMSGSRWGGGPDAPPPPENYKNMGFLSNTGPDPLKIIKLPIQHSMLGHHRPASETPFKWRLSGGPLMARI